MSRIAKFRKQLEKKDKFNIGLSPVRDWISTGNAGLNNIISNNMWNGVATGRGTAFAGLNGTGKSFLAANVIREAQKKGYFVVFIDTEFAASDDFMTKIGVDISEEKFMPVNTSIIEDVTEFTSELFKNTEKEDKILLVIDSLSNLQPERDVSKYEEGKQAFNQGLREKMLKQLVTNICSKVGDRNMAFIFTCHMYVNGSDVYGNPILKPNVGEGTLFLPSSVVQLSKRELKDGKEITGIKVAAKMIKTRFTKLGSACSFDLPWDTGMDFLDGALETLEEAGVVEKNGGWYSYVDTETGEVLKFQSSKFTEHSDRLLDLYAELTGPVEEKSEEESFVETLD